MRLSKVEYAPKPEAVPILNFQCLFQNYERKDYIMDRLVVSYRWEGGEPSSAGRLPRRRSCRLLLNMCVAGEQNRQRGVVMSDLHLFARRSRGSARLESIRNRLGNAEVLVLNGDTFDFRWSTVGNQSETVSAAIQWLRDLAEQIPNCRIHFIVGNHDCMVSFQEELARLATSLPRFLWHEHLLRLGPVLFVHGDCAHRRMDHLGLRRFRESWQRDRRRSQTLALAYEFIDRLGITQLGHVWHFPRQQTIERLAFYLDDFCPGWRETTSDCYFGHTHLPFVDYECDGIRFHNTGSAIHNQEFNPMFFEVPRH